MKHSAELMESNVTILLKIAFCAEVSHLERYNVNEEYGLERSVGDWFGTILETFPGEYALPWEPNRDSQNPIANKNVAKVDLADGDSGKVRYSFTKRLHTAEFERKEEMIWIAEKELLWTSGEDRWHLF